MLLERKNSRHIWIADTHGSGQNYPLLGGVRFSEIWLKFSIFKLFTFFFALSRYVDIFWQKGEEIGYI